MVFPVDDLDSCISVTRAALPDNSFIPSVPGPVAHISAPFQECMLVRPGSTLNDVFQVLQHSGFVGQDRDLVRTERLLLPDPFMYNCVSDAVTKCKSRTALVKKEDLLSGFVVLKVFSNARKEWQRHSSSR
jgi:hypothetical protein